MTAITSACWTVFECWEICVTCNPRRSLLRFCIHKTSLCEHTFLRPCCACMTILFCLPSSNGLRPNRNPLHLDRKSTRLNSSHGYISYAVFCLKKKNTQPPFHRSSTLQTH